MRPKRRLRQCRRVTHHHESFYTHDVSPELATGRKDWKARIHSIALDLEYVNDNPKLFGATAHPIDKWFNHSHLSLVEYWPKRENGLLPLV